MDSALILLAQQKTGAGELPLDLSVKTYIGQSRGGKCKLCATEIRHGRVAIQMAFTGRDDKPRTVTIHAHCHTVWLAVARPMSS